MNRFRISMIGIVALLVADASLAQYVGPRGIRDIAESRQNIQNMEADAAGRSGIDKGLGHWNTVMGIFESARNYQEAADALHPDDVEFDPDFSPDGMPDMPTHCPPGEEGDACFECYRQAYEGVNFLRFWLERLRAVYGATKNYTEASIAFGDAMAGVGGGFGLAWPPERKSIQDTFAKVGKTYDQKHARMMQSLQEALQEVAQCELEYFDQPGWYERYGFMYYTFMHSRYSRPQ